MGSSSSEARAQLWPATSGTDAGCSARFIYMICLPTMNHAKGAVLGCPSMTLSPDDDGKPNDN
eukprot:1160794-Pelagomonas_calceolata.AAC.4